MQHNFHLASRNVTIATLALAIGGPALLALGAGWTPFAPSQSQMQQFLATTNLLPAHIDLVVIDEDGAPWAEEVELQVAFSPSLRRTSSRATPDSAGAATFVLNVDSQTANQEVAEVSVWRAVSDVLPDLRQQFFVDPSVGVAAFANLGMLTWTDATQSYRGNATVVMTEPPLFGEVTINLNAACAGDQISLVVADFDAGSAVSQEARLSAVPFRATLPSQSATYGIHKWGNAGAVDVGVFGPSDSMVFGGLLRRNGTLVANLGCDIDIAVSVNLVVYPTASRVMLVTPAQHVPNAQLPTNSDIGFHDQSRRASRHAPVGPGVGPGAHFEQVNSAMVAELWGKTTDASGSNLYVLLAWEAIPAASTSASIVFD